MKDNKKTDKTDKNEDNGNEDDNNKDNKFPSLIFQSCILVRHESWQVGVVGGR